MKRKICLLLAMVMVIGLLAGCGNGKTEDGEITLTWYARINQEPDSAEVFAKASELTKEKIGVNLDIIPLEDYNTKMSVIVASGEEYDLVYTSSVVNNIYKNVADGNLLELDDLLPKYAPKLWAMFDQSVWDGVRINGKIYGTPNQQIMARGPVIAIPTQNIKALGLDENNLGINSIEDLEQYFTKIKEKTGSYGYLTSAYDGDCIMFDGYEAVLGSNLPGAIKYDEENPVIVNQYDTQEYLDHIRMRRRWVENGLTAPMEVATGDITKYIKPEGEVIPWAILQNTSKPGGEADFKTNYNVDITYVHKVEPLLGSYGLVSTMASINSDSRYPEKSVEFLELINTDKELFRLLAYGIEGKHYTKVGENRIEKNTENPYTQPAWAIGNTFNGFLLPGQADDVYEQTKLLNDTAKRSPILGFAPDQDSISTEVANCKGIVDEYTLGLELGIVDVEAKYPEFIEKLKAAGSERIIAELNKQLEAWRKSK